MFACLECKCACVVCIVTLKGYVSGMMYERQFRSRKTGKTSEHSYFIPVAYSSYRGERYEFVSLVR